MHARIRKHIESKVIAVNSLQSKYKYKYRKSLLHKIIIWKKLCCLYWKYRERIVYFRIYVKMVKFCRKHLSHIYAKHVSFTKIAWKETNSIFDLFRFDHLGPKLFVAMVTFNYVSWVQMLKFILVVLIKSIKGGHDTKAQSVLVDLKDTHTVLQYIYIYYYSD